MTDRQEYLDALAHIGMQHDGRLLLERLFTVLQAVVPVGTEVGALQMQEGSRRLALELIEGLTRDHASRAESDNAVLRRDQRTHAAGPAYRPRGARRPVPVTGPGSGSGETRGPA
jgi:hypothetical protein